jgi:hypothetical protein
MLNAYRGVASDRPPVAPELRTLARRANSIPMGVAE